MSDDLIRLTRDDLSYLQREWHGSVDDETVRMTSGVLRRLLVEGNFGNAWRAVGFDGEPKIIAPRIEGLLSGPSGPRLTFVLAGGAKFAGALQAGCYTEWKPMLIDPNNLPPPEIPPLECMPDGFEWGLKKFIHSAGMFAEGRKVPRESIILFACNKMGGVHIDSTDRPTKIDGVIRRTEKNGRLGGKMPAWFEVLSIGQHVANSSDTTRYIERARESANAQ